MLKKPPDNSDVTVLLAKGCIGTVDAALVRWLARQRAQANYLVAHVTKSAFEPLVPKGHLEDFLTALEHVDEVLGGDVDLSTIPSRYRVTLKNIKTLFWPEAELLDYSITRICKQLTILEEQAVAGKLTTLDDIRERYGPAPQGRHRIIGIVSGSYDLIHPGHVRVMQVARQHVDVLVAFTMSTASIQQQEKNHLGDRPIYNERDRLEVLSALRPVDHLVMFDDRDCRHSLRAFCPNFYFKSIDDQFRPVVRAEAALVKNLGGETIYLPNHHPGYSSTAIIHYVRQHEASLRQVLQKHSSG